MGKIIGHDNKTISSSTENTSTDLLNQGLTPNISLSTHANDPLSSILSDNFAFNYAASSLPSVSEHVNSTSQSFFSTVSEKQSSRQISSLPSFESSLCISQLESNDQINNRLSLGILPNSQSQKQRDTQEKSGNDSPKPVELPITNPDINQWFYRDPQGTVQGPFTHNEMYDWFVNGYFSMDLLVRRGSDTNFSKLGDLYHSCGRAPFFSIPSPFLGNNELNANGSSLLFGSSLLDNSSMNNSQPLPIGSTIVPPSPNFLNQSQVSQLQPGGLLPQTSLSQNQISFRPVIDDLSKNPSNNFNSDSLFFNAQQSPVIKENPASVTSLLNIMQRQQSQQSDNQIANLLGIGPQNTMQTKAQLRLILCELMKNERFRHLNTSQQQQVIMEKFIQLNSQNVALQGNNEFQPPHTSPPPTDQYLNHQTPIPTCPTELLTKESLPTLLSDQIDTQKKSIFEQPVEESPESYSSSHSLNVQSQKSQLELKQQIPQSHPKQQQQSKPNALQILQAAMAVATPNSSSAWGNIVPGAMSLSAVEELQRREAEERYEKLQQQKNIDNDGFEYKVDRKRQSKVKHDQQVSKLTKSESVKQKQPQPMQVQSVQPQGSSKIQVIDSKPVIIDKIDDVQQILHEQLLQQTSLSGPQMPQLPKKSVWGNTSDSSDAASSTMTIVEIQKLQEEKEREDAENRERTLQQQMANFISNQQQTSRVGAPPLKWASQQWQEQNNSKIKTLVEIQAEEAEKAALLRTQQENEARRRMQVNTNVTTPLSAIVAKNAGGAPWNNNNSQLFASQKSTGFIWEEEENHISTSSDSMPTNSGTSSKSSSNKSTKVDSAFIKQILKTNPKSVKKLDVSVTLKKNFFNDSFFRKLNY